MTEQQGKVLSRIALGVITAIAGAVGSTVGTQTSADDTQTRLVAIERDMRDLKTSVAIIGAYLEKTKPPAP